MAPQLANPPLPVTNSFTRSRTEGTATRRNCSNRGEANRGDLQLITELRDEKAQSVAVNA
jgi:hypothetical protein